MREYLWTTNSNVLIVSSGNVHDYEQENIEVSLPEQYTYETIGEVVGHAGQDSEEDVVKQYELDNHANKKGKERFISYIQ